MEHGFLPITTHPHGGAGCVALHLNTFESFNALQWHLALLVKGKNFWDPSHAQGNFFSNPSM
jgi:hypothetical protein